MLFSNVKIKDGNICQIGESAQEASFHEINRVGDAPRRHDKKKKIDRKGRPSVLIALYLNLCINVNYIKVENKKNSYNILLQEPLFQQIFDIFVKKILFQ